ILHGTFIFTSHAHKSVESISDNLSSLNGALELIKKDLRYLHPSHFIGRKGYIEVLSYTPLHSDNEPYLQKIYYAIEGSRLMRKNESLEVKKIIILDNLDFFDIEFFDKQAWKKEWDYKKSGMMPEGIRVTIGCRGKSVVMVLDLG
ncbi:MAG: type II secretion system protein GspJ, partial [Nitrospirota bacterium]